MDEKIKGVTAENKLKWRLKACDSKLLSLYIPPSLHNFVILWFLFEQISSIIIHILDFGVVIGAPSVHFVCLLADS